MEEALKSNNDPEMAVDKVILKAKTESDVVGPAEMAKGE